MACSRETARCQHWIKAAKTGTPADVVRPPCCTAALEALLFRLHDVLYDTDNKWFVDFGTMLGFYRDGKIIDHDTDIDIALPASRRADFLAHSDALTAGGFHLQPRGGIIRMLYSRLNDIHIDFWIYHDQSMAVGPDGFLQYVHPAMKNHCSVIPTRSVMILDTIRAYDRDWPIPSEPLAILERRYGKEDWQRPQCHSQGCKLKIIEPD